MKSRFAAHVVWVKQEYDLAVTTGEASALEKLFWTCDLSVPPLLGAE